MSPCMITVVTCIAVTDYPIYRPSYVRSSHIGSGGRQWWMTVALSDLVNHPLISEIVDTMR